MKTTGTIIADFNTTTDSVLNIGGTSMTLDSNIDKDGTTLPNGRYFFTLDLGVKREYISGDLVGKAVSNIKHITRQGVESTGVTIQHNRGVACVISGFPHLVAIQKLIEGSTDLNSLTPIKYDGTATINNNAHIATKAYTDSKTYTMPATDASTSVFGIRKVSVAPVSATDPIEVATTDPRIPTQGENDAMAGTTGTPSDTNRYVTATDPQITTNNLLTSGVQTVAGIKTFSSIPILPATLATDANQMVTKNYIDWLQAGVTTDTINLSGKTGYTSVTALYGVRLQANKDIIVRSVKCTASVDTRCILKTDAGATIESTSIVSEIATFTGNTIIPAFTYFRIESDKNGSSYVNTRYGAITLPWIQTNLSFVSGSINGANDTTYTWNIEEIRTASIT